MQSIAVSNDAAQSLYFIAGRTLVQVQLRWLPLPAHWYITVSIDDQPLTTNRQVTTWGPLVSHSAFPGELIAWPIAGINDDPLRNAWASTHELRWIEPAELGRP